jgi:hypothetical protein
MGFDIDINKYIASGLKEISSASIQLDDSIIKMESNFKRDLKRKTDYKLSDQDLINTKESFEGIFNL